MPSSIIYILVLSFVSALNVIGQSHPGIILTGAGVEKIKSEKFPPIFDKVYKESKYIIDQAIASGIDVPVPKDMAGGYTHETHKRNYKNMHLAGSLYQISGDEKYANYIKDILFEYAAMYGSLPKHPTDRSYSTGKIFWQCLNDANWLVYTSQAYDAIYDYLSVDERQKIEDDLLKPFADFISIENPKFFNRIHNHSTWGNAAVGMIALVMNNQERLDRALYGLNVTNQDQLAKDNDGGFIYEKGERKAGFFAQLDNAFSPDGYYTEGPYYQRYAMLPFLLFAQALDNKRPDLKIFEYRNGLLIKAVEALIYQTNSEGEFFPINDAQKGMSIKAQSVVTALNIAYNVKKTPVLLSAAHIQNRVLLDQNGFEVAKDLASGDVTALSPESIYLSDGKDGDKGALILIRAGDADRQITTAFKCTSQGLGHGHYDKLSYSLYDGPTELLQDFGAARWVNVDQKAGGRYLPENKTWAKQTIAHNTLVVDETSHFGGVYKIAKDNHSDPLYFHSDNKDLQVASAKEVNAYENVEMQRTLVLWNNEYFGKPILIDLFTASSDIEHTYDMPYQHAAQIMQSNFDIKINDPKVMGANHGYQHLFREGVATLDAEGSQVNLLKENKFYTITSVSSSDDEMILARMGANDPQFNIRRDPLLIHRKSGVQNALFLSAIESHGHYSAVSEVPIQPYPKIQSIKVIEHQGDNVIFAITSMDKDMWEFGLDMKTGIVNVTKK